MNTLDLYHQRGLIARRVSGHKGGEHHGPCPGCGGRDRFHLWPGQGDAGTYWCRQCGKSGDAIQFLRDFEGASFREACTTLGRNPGAFSYQNPCPPLRRQESWQPSPATSPNPTWQAKAGALVDWAHQQLLQCPEQLQWLAERGIDRGTAWAFMLGWNPGERGKDIWRPREAWGLSEELNEGTGRPKKLWLPQGLIVPTQDGAGAIQRVRIRRPEGEPRYYVVPGSGSAPLYLGLGHQASIVVEAELDGLALFEAAGDLAGVYAIGNSSAKPDTASASRLRQLDRILIATDFDTPDHHGQRPGTKAAGWWLEHFPQAERWPVPTGKDPGEAYRLGLDLRAWIKAGLPSCALSSK